MKLLPWAAAAVFGGVMVYLVGTDKFHTADGKFLGFVQETEGFGLDDVAKGAVIVIGAGLIGKAVHGMIPAIPAGKV